MAPRIKHTYVVTERREVREHIASHDTFPVDASHTLASWVQQQGASKAKKKSTWSNNEAQASAQPPPLPTKPFDIITNTTKSVSFPRSISFPYRRACKLEPYMPQDEEEDQDPDQPQPQPDSRRPAKSPAAAREKEKKTKNSDKGGNGDEDSTVIVQQQRQQQQEQEQEQGGGDDDDDDQYDAASDAPSTESVVWLSRPFVTLTWTQSLDGQIAVSPPPARCRGDGDGGDAPAPAPALPGPSTPKPMTHFLRSRYDAVLVGVGTAAADDPGLDCRLEVEMGGGHQPRPVILDPFARWDITPDSAVIRIAREGLGQPPWVLHIAPIAPDPRHVAVVEAVGGRYLPLALTRIGGQKQQQQEEDTGRQKRGNGGKQQGRRRQREGGGTRYMLEWVSVLTLLRGEGVRSLLVEGGGRVINDLLALANRGVDVVDSLLVTIAPVFFGDGGVSVCPTRPYLLDETMRIIPGPRLADVVWTQMGEDMVMCGRVMR